MKASNKLSRTTRDFPRKHTHRSSVLKDEVEEMGRGRRSGHTVVQPRGVEARNLFPSIEQVVPKAGTKDAHNRGRRLG